MPDESNNANLLNRWETGAPVEGGANAPILLSDPDDLWLVEEGDLDVFLVSLDEGGKLGKRRHLWSAGPGAAVLGIEPRAIAHTDAESAAGTRQVGLLAVGTAGTSLRKYSLKRLEAVAMGTPDAIPALASVIESYLEGVSRAAEDLDRPQLDVLLSAGQAIAVRKGHYAGTSSDLIWVSHDTGSSLLYGIEGLRVDPDAPPLPLGCGMFIESADDETRLSVETTPSCLSRGLMIRSLDALRTLFMAFAEKLSEWDEEAELRRVARKSEAEQSTRRRGLAALASVLSSTTAAPPTAGAADQLLDVCQIVGEASGINFRAPAAWEAAGRVHDELGAICRASRVRNRRVALRGKWWRTDSGPLLAFISPPAEPKNLDTGDIGQPGAAGAELPGLGAAADGRPADADPSGNAEADAEAEAGEARTTGVASRHVRSAQHRPIALLPDGHGRYSYLDPDSLSYKRVDGRFAALLEPFAYSFYRPLPDQPLGGFRLLKVAVQGLGRDFGMVAIMALSAGLLGLALPIATGEMFSSVIPGARANEVWVLLAALVAVNFGTALSSLTRAFALVRIEGESTASLQASVIDRLLALPVPFFRRFSAGDLTQRALGINAARSLLSGAALNSLLSGVLVLTNLGLMLYYDISLALVAVGMLVGVTIVTIALSIPALRAERRRINTQGKIAGLVFEMVSGIAKLRIAAAEARGFSVWADEFRVQKLEAYRARSFQNAVTVLNDAVPLIGSLALFATARSLIGSGSDFNTGQFIAFNAAFGIFIASGTALSNTLVSLLNVRPLLERAAPILQALPEVDADKPDPGELTGRIELSHIDFRYVADGPLVLNDLSLTANPGDFIALVGPSGSGKSTTLRLLLGFETPENGAVYYDNQDLAALDRSAVRSQMGVVLQSSRILSGDIFTNLVGSAPLSLDDAWEAAEAAGIADDIRAMPMGMNTMIAEGGSTISGGQRQRLLIARALIRKPRIILFDEATSALDNRTQQHVTESLDKLHTTRVVIAHRLSTIRHADRIYVIEAGRRVQAGSFDELATQSGMFAELIKRQMA
jgi:NHLM bacteriocin system ABC transporter ATP-binding protein